MSSLSRLGRVHPPRACRASPRRRPLLEPLEDRCVPAAPTPVSIGAFDPSTATWFLRNEVSPGAADAGVFQFGPLGTEAFTGDWTGSGQTGIGVYDAATGE